MEQDIRESKEYRLAKEWEMAVNSYAFNPARFAAAIPDMHPTLQQSLYRLIKSWRTKPAVTTTATVRRTRRRNESWNISKRTEDTFH